MWLDLFLVATGRYCLLILQAIMPCAKKSLDHVRLTSCIEVGLAMQDQWNPYAL